MTSVTQFNAIFVTQKCFFWWLSVAIIFVFEQTCSFCLQKKKHFQSVDLFSVYLLSRVDIVIRYIEVDFTFGLPDYVRYIEEFVISRFYSIHFTVTFAGT